MTKNLKHAIIMMLVAACLISMTSILLADTQDDVIFRAMSDELDRNMSDLVMPGLDRPYFIGYTIDDYQTASIVGTLGTLTQSYFDRSKYLTIDLRVGDNHLDNTNFAGNLFDRSQNYFRLTKDDDYDAISNQIYLGTDRLYKAALKDISKKRAYLQTRVIKNRPADFLSHSANKYIGPKETFDINEIQLDSLIASASRVFRAYPMIISSELRLTASIDNQYFANSVGSRSIRGDRIYAIGVSMSAKTPEGEDIDDSDQIIVKRLAELPDAKALAQWVKDKAEKMKALTSSETIDEYSGPVIFEGDASGEFFRQLFAKNISDGPTPLYENDEMAKRAPGPELISKIKRRVMPDFFDIYDDPTIDTLNGRELIGNFAVDDAGNPPRRIQIVQKGKLVDIPIGVSPTKQIAEPNGHARGAVGTDVNAKPSNLIIESSDKVPMAELKKAMLQICEDAGLEYGLIVKKLDDVNSAHGGFFFGSGGGENNLAAPLEVYKVYPDGKEELVRNLEFSDVSVRILKDIVQTDDKQYCHNYLIGNDPEMPVSIVAPSVLIEEMDLKKSEAKIKTPPILPSPLAKK